MVALVQYEYTSKEIIISLIRRRRRIRSGSGRKKSD
jgi:hypothetical protein